MGKERERERELKIAESARNADAQLKLQVTSEDERREMHFNTAGNKFIMSFVRYLCRATVVSHKGVDYGPCKCRCNARTVCGSRTCDSSLSPTGELYRAQCYPEAAPLFFVYT